MSRDNVYLAVQEDELGNVAENIMNHQRKSDHVIKPIPEENYSGDENLGNEHSLITHVETEHHVSCYPESSDDADYSFLKDQIRFKHYFHGHLYYRTEHIVRGSHYKCEIALTLPLGWPKHWKSIRIYQLCNLDHSMIYRNGSNKILRKYLFYTFDLDSESDGFVVDNTYAYGEGKLYYAEIDEEEYRKKGCFRFTDGPRGEWDSCVIDNGIFLLEEIDKKQDFRDYVVAVTGNGKEIPLICLKWGYRFIEQRQKRPEHIRWAPVEVDLEEFPFPPEGILKLPNANDRIFLLQLPNDSSGIPAEIIEYPNPKALPEGYDKEKFEKEIIRSLVLPPGTN